MEEIDSGIFVETVESENLTDRWAFALLHVKSSHPFATEDMGSMGVVAFKLSEDKDIDYLDRKFFEIQSPFIHEWRNIENFFMWKHTNPFFSKMELDEMYQKWRELSGEKP